MQAYARKHTVTWSSTHRSHRPPAGSSARCHPSICAPSTWCTTPGRWRSHSSGTSPHVTAPAVATWPGGVPRAVRSIGRCGTSSRNGSVVPAEPVSAVAVRGLRGRPRTRRTTHRRACRRAESFDPPSSDRTAELGVNHAVAGTRRDSTAVRSALDSKRMDGASRGTRPKNRRDAVCTGEGPLGVCDAHPPPSEPGMDGAARAVVRRVGTPTGRQRRVDVWSCDPAVSAALYRSVVERHPPGEPPC